MASKESEAWAQLVCVTEIDTEPVSITGDRFFIGRTNDSDISHAGNKLISGKHCYIERDKQGKAWLYDTSTNGTLLNLKFKLTKGECRELHHGDEFHLVHKKDSPDDDVAYMFQDLKALDAETSSDFDSTQEYDYVDPNATQEDAEANIVSTPSPPKKRKISEELQQSPGKKIKLDDSKAPEDTSGPSTSKPKTEDKVKTPHTSTKEACPSASTSKPVKEPEEDAIAETLVCIICQELLHDCISLQPCMHSYCSGCYSEWMERSNECPSCRLKVERINKNHIVNNLVEAYLKLNPDKKRLEDEIQALQAKNKITRDMLYPEKQNTGLVISSQNEDDSNTDDDDGHYDDDDDEEEEDGYDDEDDDNGYFAPAANNFITLPGTHFGNPAPWIACQSCPNYDPNMEILAMPPRTFPPVPAGDPTDPDAKTMPPFPVYQCRPGGSHLMCMCCMKRMPDRRREYNDTPNCAVPPQQCALCARFFCHAYWGCRRGDCNGCLAKLEDMSFGKACLNFIILDNFHESTVFRNYVEARDLSVRDILGECLTKMVAREYTCTDQARLDGLAGTRTPVCYTCGIRNFKDLVYCLRRDIPKEELPKEVTSRPDCHWGKNCRTQRNKPEHARRYNHICEQTRVA